MLKGNMLIAHGGGPTPVINSSLRGAVEAASGHSEIERIYGARFGALGILSNDLIDLSAVNKSEIELLSETPASALGSCRKKLSDKDYPQVLECLQKNNIRYFFYNGGNDSMDTCRKINILAKDRGYDLRVIGIPKTIDNDLVETDHSPGYGSAARFAAVAAAQLAQDASSLPIHIVVAEFMGRNAGWITAATALYEHTMPCELMVYLPEVSFDKQAFLQEAQRRFAKGRGLLVCISEGIKDINGAAIGDTGIKDGFGHIIPGGAAQSVADMILCETPLKARSEKPGLLGRVSMEHVSPVDRQEAYLAGAHAVEYALKGNSGGMVSIRASREPEYSARFELAPLDIVANAEKKFPLEWYSPESASISDEFRKYCEPLVAAQAPRYAKIR